MSPASQGALEVERYVGSCLISSSLRPSVHKPLSCRKQEQGSRAPNTIREQCQVQFGSTGTWAGGAPLISMTSNPRRNNLRLSPPLNQQQQQQQLHQQPINEQGQGHLHNSSPLTRLAVQTQGAPLILSGRFHNRVKTHGSAGAVSAMAVNNVAGLLNGCGNNNGTCNNNNNNAAMASAPVNAARNQPPTRSKPFVEQPAKKSQQSPSKTESLSNAPNKDTPGANIANIDSLSIASDESSGSNNSENSLPRIIKPRKRRKKDRKPPVNAGNGTATAPSTELPVKPEEFQQLPTTTAIPNGHTEQSSMVPMKPFVQNCYDSAARYNNEAHFRGHRRPQIVRESAYGRLHQNPTSSSPSTCPNVASNPSTQEVVDTRQRYAHRHLQVKVLDDNRNVVVPVPVRQAKGYPRNGNNNAGTLPPTRYLHDYAEPITLSCQENLENCLQSSICQCRYCDPSGLIWDVDQNGYSQFLTPPSADFNGIHHHHHHHHHRYPQIPVFLTRPSYVCQEHGGPVELFDADNPCLRIRERDGAILRRSWSDPTNYFSEEIVPNRDVGVIGDRGHSELSKGKNSWRGDASSAISNSATNPSNLANVGNGGVTGSQGLEVSTEIVTSPNGHRDLEIKFYSSSPSSTHVSDDKTSFAFPDDEPEDFNDIWSYHKSKLQQDFRTLLQAEE